MSVVGTIDCDDGLVLRPVGVLAALHCHVCAALLLMLQARIPHQHLERDHREPRHTRDLVRALRQVLRERLPARRHPLPVCRRLVQPALLRRAHCVWNDYSKGTVFKVGS